MESNIANDTKLPFPYKQSKDEEVWSDNYFVCTLKEELATVEFTPLNLKTDLLDCSRNFDSRKYYNQAYHYLKIGALQQVPLYLVSLSDLSSNVVKALVAYDKADRAIILKQAVGRIFEDISPRLYHDSVSKLLVVELVK